MASSEGCSLEARRDGSADSGASMMTMCIDRPTALGAPPPAFFCRLLPLPLPGGFTGRPVGVTRCLTGGLVNVGVLDRGLTVYCVRPIIPLLLCLFFLALVTG